MMDLVLTPEKLTELKEKVAAEMKRRNAPEHNASLNAYGTKEWEYENPPKVADELRDEYVQKIIDPLLQVNDFLSDNSFTSGKTGLERSLYKAEEFVDSLAKMSYTDTNSGCRGSCTGLCAEACTGECTGCSSCSGGCSTSCGKSCGSNCGGGCSGCTGGCHTGCTKTCGSGCQTSLRY